MQEELSLVREQGTKSRRVLEEWRSAQGTIEILQQGPNAATFHVVAAEVSFWSMPKSNIVTKTLDMLDHGAASWPALAEKKRRNAGQLG